MDFFNVSLEQLLNTGLAFREQELNREAFRTQNAGATQQATFHLPQNETAFPPRESTPVANRPISGLFGNVNQPLLIAGGLLLIGALAVKVLK